MFRDRVDAGRQLAQRVKALTPDGASVVVLGIPRGGVVVAAEVARGIGAPLDVIIARKIGSPMNPEYAIGAIGIDGKVLIDRAAVASLAVPDSYTDSQSRREKAELERRMKEYRGDSPPYELEGRIVVLVDDGVATGLTMRVAISSTRTFRPEKIVVALPVAPPSTTAELRKYADEVIVLLEPATFFAVGQWYERFEQVDDAEVKSILTHE
jgi:putative phosphoribosyl transferase